MTFLKYSAAVSRIIPLALLVFIWVLQLGVYSQQQPRIAGNNGRGDDGVTYGQVAEQIRDGSSIEGPAPFVYLP